jgi:hypothetical protein
MGDIFNHEEIRRRTVEAREAVGDLTDAQKLADLLKHHYAARHFYEELHGPLPQPGAGECEPGPELPPVGTVVIASNRAGLMWDDRDDTGACIFSNGRRFYVHPHNRRFATDAEIGAFLAELPR